MESTIDHGIQSDFTVHVTKTTRIDSFNVMCSPFHSELVKLPTHNVSEPSSMKSYS